MSYTNSNGQRRSARVYNNGGDVTDYSRMEDENESEGDVGFGSESEIEEEDIDMDSMGGDSTQQRHVDVIRGVEAKVEQLMVVRGIIESMVNDEKGVLDYLFGLYSNRYDGNGNEFIYECIENDDDFRCFLYRTNWKAIQFFMFDANYQYDMLMDLSGGEIVSFLERVENEGVVVY